MKLNASLHPTFHPTFMLTDRQLSLHNFFTFPTFLETELLASVHITFHHSVTGPSAYDFPVTDVVGMTMFNGTCVSTVHPNATWLLASALRGFLLELFRRRDLLKRVTHNRLPCRKSLDIVCESRVSPFRVWSSKKNFLLKTTLWGSFRDHSFIT